MYTYNYLWRKNVCLPSVSFTVLIVNCSYFFLISCTEATVCLNTSRTPLTWPPSTEQQSPNPNNLEEEESDLADLERSGLLNETSLLYHDSQNKVNLLCGETDVEFEIHTYRFKYEDTIDETMTQPQSKAEYSTDED